MGWAAATVEDLGYPEQPAKKSNQTRGSSTALSHPQPQAGQQLSMVSPDDGPRDPSVTPEWSQRPADVTNIAGRSPDHQDINIAGDPGGLFYWALLTGLGMRAGGDLVAIDALAMAYGASKGVHACAAFTKKLCSVKLIIGKTKGFGKQAPPECMWEVAGVNDPAPSAVWLPSVALCSSPLFKLEALNYFDRPVLSSLGHSLYFRNGSVIVDAAPKTIIILILR
ncbi:hypothetical protein C8R43DRAFT_962060 [Mycena crocata]|nr:hypothetical protein C8R43DRAFT_962060 [Mycena crocata]